MTTAAHDSPLPLEALLPSPIPYPHPGPTAKLLLPLAYVIMGICYFLALRNATNGFWYPPIAFGKLLLLVYGPYALVAVLGSELILMAVQYVQVAHVGFLSAGLVSIATTAEALLAWWLLRWRPITTTLSRRDDLPRLLIFAGLIPNLAGALLGTLLLRGLVNYGTQVAPAALLWAFGDFVTTITWMPAFVLWVSPLLCGTAHRLPPRRRMLELVLILLVSVATCALVAEEMMHRPTLREYNLKFLCFLPLVWAGIRFGLAGTTSSLAVASTAWAMLYGNAHPQNLADLAGTIEQVQVFNLALGVAGLTLGWAIDAERQARDTARQLADALQAKEARLHEAFAAAAVAQEHAQRAGQIKQRLLSAVSHELRTPLTPVALLLSDLTRRSDLPPDARQSAELAMHQVEVEAAVVEELLEYADLMCGAEIRLTDTTWNTLLTPLRPIIECAATETNTHLAWKSPEADHKLTVDQRKLRRAILHVVRHALCLSRPGGEVRIAATFEPGALVVECHVVDLKADCTPRDIEPFASTDQQLNGHHDGLGLAFASARLIAQRHDGSLLVSESSNSVTYTLRISGSTQALSENPSQPL